MHTLAVRRSFALVAIGALTATGLSLGPVAAVENPPPSQDALPSPERRPAMAAGVIVKTTTTTASTGLVRAAERALPQGVDLGEVRASASGRRTSVLPTSKRVPAADAEAVAAQLRGRPDVEWAAPNYILRPHANPPVPATDPYFAQDKARAVWDWRSRSDSKVRSVLGSSNSFGSGGFSSRAPYAWQATKGKGAVVAVLDTGITAHPDLPTWNGTTASGRILQGRDFVSQYEFEDGELEDTGRDGDGWDPNPQDRGDYTTEDDYCYPNEERYGSSWHGTHVAGILGAAKDNGGTVGVAPEVEILPVRVLGLCGGTTEDIIAAMRWSVGEAVQDPVTGAPVPINENPADVLNLSLGEYRSCSSQVVNSLPMRDAIADVRSRGAVIVASAGNDGVNITTNQVLPASCAGVLAVGATSEYGDRAGYPAGSRKRVYSNYGSAVDLVAPGGDVFWSESGGIVSSVNSGSRSPVGPTYARYSGTSMAAPVVSAAAALLKSVKGDLTAAETDAAIKASVQAFPRGTSSQFKPCSTTICGKGIIDLSKIQVPRSKPTISGTPVIGEPLTAARGSWVRIPSTLNYQWLRNGIPIPGATGPTYYPTREDAGWMIAVRTSPDTAAYSMFGSTSDPTAVHDGPEVTMTGLPATVTYGAGATATVTVTSEGAPVDGVVELRRGSTVLASRATTGGTAELTIGGTAWAAGSNVIRAAFVANETSPAASSVGTPVTVTKASSTIATKLPTSVRYTSRATIGIAVAVAGVPNPTGQLRIYDGSRKIVYATLSSSAGGKRSILLPRLAKGYHNIKVVYSGSSVISPKTSITRRIKSY